MKFTLQLIVFLITVTAFSKEALTVKKIREPGDALDTSISQELDHALYNAKIWLKRRQNSDGSFGSTDKIKCTAVVILALAEENNQANAVISSKAAKWLTKELNTNSTTNIATAAWCSAAMKLSSEAKKSSKIIKNLQKFIVEQCPKSTNLTAQLCTEILLSTTPDNSEIKLNSKQVNAENYLYPDISLTEMWINARSINRSGGQLYSETGERVDWRRKYASKLIDCQKIEPEGGGYWSAVTPAETLRNTALAIIILKEL